MMAFLLDDILLAPLKGVKWLGEKLKEVIDEEMGTEKKLKAELLELQMKLEMGDISQDVCDKREKEILVRLEAIRKQKGESHG